MKKVIVVNKTGNSINMFKAERYIQQIKNYSNIKIGEILYYYNTQDTEADCDFKVIDLKLNSITVEVI